MTKSSDDTRNQKTSMRDQLRSTKIHRAKRHATGTGECTTKIPSEGWPLDDTEIEANPPNGACGRLICEPCSEPHRLKWISQSLAIAKARPGRHEIATIFLGPIPTGFLSGDVKLVRERLRNLLELASFQESFLRGGIDVQWEHIPREWWLYAHVLAIGVPSDAWAKLLELLRIAKPYYYNPDLLEVQALRDPEKQVPNLVRFHTYFWPHHGVARSPAIRLHADCRRELAAWALRHTFNEFTFQYPQEG